MKINVFKSVLAASLVAATLASCQSEPEVGSCSILLQKKTTLLRRSSMRLAPMVISWHSLARGLLLLSPWLAIAQHSMFRLSSPAEKDVTVTLAASSDGITAGNDEW